VSGLDSPTATGDLGTLEGPLLIFGGPYSNRQATLAMRAEAERRQIPPSRVICTGDVVAYCADPEVTVELIRAWGIAVVMGNCEESLAADADDCGCGFDQGSSCDLLSSQWYSYARQRLSPASKRWMQQLPRAILLRLNGLRLNGLRVRLIHGSVDRINGYVFGSSSTQELTRQLDLAATDLVIGGHCGIPFGRQLGARGWLNAGVIGMPANDGTPDGWYLLLTPTVGGVVASWHRLAYDQRGAAQALQAEGLVQGYARALESGCWPSLQVLPEAERAQAGRPLVLPELPFSLPT